MNGDHGLQKFYQVDRGHVPYREKQSLGLMFSQFATTKNRKNKLQSKYNQSYVNSLATSQSLL